MKEIQLSRPSEYELDDAYRQLSRGGNVLIEIEPPDLKNILYKLEDIGFVGIELPYYTLERNFVSISGFKGKHGPCFDTGLKAAYIGSALAAYDDDNHLLTRGKESPVCEKTASIYRFPPYRGLINIFGDSEESEGQQDLIPGEFGSYNLDDELNALYSRLKDTNVEENRLTAFYPGPFRTLILADGTIIKRGELNSIPESEIRDLVRSDRFIKMKSDTDVKPVFFQDEYKDHGPRCLQMNQKVVDNSVEIHQVDLAQLDFNALKLRTRLKGLIDENRKYFILTGSDPSDELGCCPSDEVGEANRLVSAGVLSSVSQEAFGDTCPVSYYAFKDEIFVQEDDIIFRKNEEIRREVGLLFKNPKIHVHKRIIRWILLGFVAISLVFAFQKILDNTIANEHHSLYEQLSVMNEDVIMILLFHNRVRCDMCLNMEQHIRTFLEDEYAGLVRDEQIRFYLMDMNAPENKFHTDRFDLYTASIVMVKMVGGEEELVIILDDIWKEHEDEISFKERIGEQLEILLSK